MFTTSVIRGSAAPGYSSGEAMREMEKIAKERRDRQLVLADGAHVIWAIPNRISAACKINQNTKYVLVVTKERIRHERRNQRLD